VLGTDPAVRELGTDPGYRPDAGTLRAPDIGVGNVPSSAGTIAGVPMLAVEYAERDLGVLQRWFQHALNARTAEQVFA
jgi:hypothetical protein